jgi:hypothetical protein
MDSNVIGNVSFQGGPTIHSTKLDVLILCALFVGFGYIGSGFTNVYYSARIIYETDSKSSDGPVCTRRLSYSLAFCFQKRMKQERLFFV